MIELRKDYILDRWSYIALGRGKRPQETETAANGPIAGGTCYFCPGNESLTPPETGRLSGGDGWRMRWFPNKFPAVDPELRSEIILCDFHTRAEAFGYHEVIVETPDHSRQLAGLSAEEICLVLRAYAARMAELSQREGVRYVQIFKNNGAEGGCSIAHSHSQIIAGGLVPRYVLEKVESAKKFDHCPYCDIIRQEEASERMIAANDTFVAFATFAPRFNFEVLIFPKEHHRNLTDISEAEFDDLAQVFHKILARLNRIGAAYNFFLHVSPVGEDLHFHFEIAPRLNIWAGFELATDSYVITTSPEEAAAFYRE